MGNRNAVTDACVAMISARSAVLAALMNVRINLGSLKDRTFVEQLQSEAVNWCVKPVSKRKSYWMLSTKI